MIKELAYNPSLSATFFFFAALIDLLSVDVASNIHILYNNAGIDFIHANAKHLIVASLLSPLTAFRDVHPSFKEFFAYNM